jgi:hypothetical protein
MKCTGSRIKKFTILTLTVVASAAAVGTLAPSAVAGVNGLPGSPGSISCRYGLPLISTHMAFVHGLNTTNYFDHQRVAFAATVTEWVNGSWQTQVSPTYSARVGETQDVYQWFMPNGAAVSPSADFYTFRLVGSRYVYVTYYYAWVDELTGQGWTDSTRVGPIQC